MQRGDFHGRCDRWCLRWPVGTRTLEIGAYFAERCIVPGEHHEVGVRAKKSTQIGGRPARYS